MAYKAVIAEKPSVAKEIAAVLGATTPHRDGPNGYLEGNGYRVTWAFGHLVRLYSPEEMGYERNMIPIIPEKWPLHVITKRDKDGKPVVDPLVKKQLGIIKDIFDGCSEIIVATDAGREGELIFRYIYEYLKCGKPFKRLWISSLTNEAIRDGFRDLRDGSEFDVLSDAAHLRSQSDWLVGFNASKALRIATGFRGTLSLGRVQTPTMGMICERYLANKSFVPTPFWKILADTNKDGKAFTVVSDKDYKDEGSANKDMYMTRAKGVLIAKEVEKKNVTSHPPLLFDLTSLQRAANSKNGLTAQETLKAAQSLYEQKYLTYPRTGSRYIPDDVFKEIPKLIHEIGKYDKYENASRELDGARLCRKSVDNGKVTDHHALLPTPNIPVSLSGHEKIIWELVAGRVLEAFGQDSLSEATTVTFDGNGVVYKAKGSVILKAGWKAVNGAQETKSKDDQDDGDVDQKLPAIKEGDILNVNGIRTEQRTDKPLPIYTDNTLLGDMETCGKTIDDEAAREAMKDVGLGTVATRAATIETLIIRKYIERDGKKLLPTELGLQIWKMVKGRMVADVKTTGEWERDLGLLEQGKLKYSSFENDVIEHTKEIVADLKENCKSLDGIQQGMTESYSCPFCGKPMKKTKFGIWCSPEAGGCGYNVNLEKSGKKLPESAIKKLCEGKQTQVISGFTSQKGTKFNAALKTDPETRKIVFVFDEAPKIDGGDMPECPCCGKKLSDGKWDIYCDCGLKIPKSLCGKTFTEKQIQKLIEGGSIFVKGFKSSKGKIFDANVRVDAKQKKVVFDFNKD